MTGIVGNDGARRQADQALAVPVEPVARLDPTGFDPSRGAGFRPLREFLDEFDAQLRAEQGWLRYWWYKLRARVMVRWRLRLHYWLHPSSLGYVSPEAFAAFTPEDIAETRAAIAMEARQGGDTPCPGCGGVGIFHNHPCPDFKAGLHPKDDSAGPKDIAQKGSHD